MADQFVDTKFQPLHFVEAFLQYRNLLCCYLRTYSIKYFAFTVMKTVIIQ